jgi:PAP_fibrillin
MLAVFESAPKLKVDICQWYSTESTYFNFLISLTPVTKKPDRSFIMHSTTHIHNNRHWLASTMPFSSPLQLPLLPVQILLLPLLLLVCVLPDDTTTTHAWVVVPTPHATSTLPLLSRTALCSVTPPATFGSTNGAAGDASSAATASFLKTTLARQVLPTNRGRSASLQQREDLQQTLGMLETCCTARAPARSTLVEGTWVVEYTTAPPPSNGVLGVFQGMARQRVELDTNKYCNLLSVGDDIIAAELVARWEEWDGVLLQDTKQDGLWKGDGVGEETLECKMKTPIPKKDPTVMESIMASLFDRNKPKSPATPDYGATCWVVTFETLEIKLFGITLLQQKFDNVKRVWRTTYVDDDTRIVRAGRTGKREDEMVFYMTRDTNI